jgi:hypothetical protein
MELYSEKLDRIMALAEKQGMYDFIGSQMSKFHEIKANRKGCY